MTCWRSYPELGGGGFGGGGPPELPREGGGGGATGGGGGGGGPVVVAGWLLTWGTCACGAGSFGVEGTTGAALLFGGVGGTPCAPRAPGGGGCGSAFPVVATLGSAG